jgi:hypothetical protein
LEKFVYCNVFFKKRKKYNTIANRLLSNPPISSPFPSKKNITLSNFFFENFCLGKFFFFKKICRKKFHHKISLDKNFQKKKFERVIFFLDGKGDDIGGLKKH